VTGEQPWNRLTIDAVVAERGEIRFTPAGIPVVELLLQHRSTQVEAGLPRLVDCAVRAKVLGDRAKHLAGIAPGERIRCTGFLARRSRHGAGVQLHVQEFELLRGE
jgi:primosomal replication protein N